MSESHLSLRKIILLPLLIISLSSPAQKFFFGVNAGLNVTNQRVHSVYSFLNSKSTSFFENLNRPTVGCFFQYNFSESMGVRINAQYLGLGYRNDGTSGNYTSNSPPQGTDVKLNYVSFPVTIRYNVTNHFGLSAGSYLSFMVGGSKINNQPVTNVYDRYDSGLIIGGEHHIYKDLSLGINYVIGLTNTWIDNSAGYSTTSSFTNRALQFLMIYKFKKTS